MENGQKVKIPLDSGLDVKSSDMLVSVQEPKFQHNRQKFQGRYLPSSVRFEHDGWAAGNDVYQFNINDYFVEAGSFQVSRYKINNYPIYKINFNKDDEEVGSVVYSSNSRFLDSNTDTRAVTGGVNPVITGTINGKEFKLNYDSITTDVTRDPETNENIVLKATSIADDYVININLQDMSATIDMQFPGITLATTEMKNGDYIIGTFEMSVGNKSIWRSGKYTIETDRDDLENPFKVKDAEGNVIDLPDLQYSETEDGLVSVSFTAPIKFTDTPQVMIQDFFPFFSGIAASPENGKINIQAAETIKCNKWSVSQKDIVNTGRHNKDKLYRNFIPDVHEDFNYRTIEQNIPCWFGVSVDGGFYQNTIGLEVVTPPDTQLASWNIYDVAYGSAQSYLSGATVTLKCKTTEDVQKYSGSCYNANIHIWEGTADKTDDYLSNTVSNVTVTINYGVGYWVAPQCTTDYHIEYRHESKTITLSTEYSNLTPAKLRQMFSWSSNVDGTYFEIYSASISSNSGTITFTADLTECPFYKSGSLIIRCTETNSEIYSTPTLKGVYDDLGNTKAKYAQKLKTNVAGNMHEGDTSYDALEGFAFWGRCVSAKVASKLWIDKDGILDSNLDASYFDIMQVTPSDTQNFANVNSLFKHSVIQAICQAKLDVSIYLVSKDVTQTVFYTTVTPMTSDTDNTYYMPGHIMFGDIGRVNSDLCHMSTYKIAKKYTSQSFDYNYGFNFSITGDPVTTGNDADSPFSYILNINPSVNTEDMLKGNKFSEEDVEIFAQKVSFNAKTPSYWIDISEDVGNDVLYIKDASQTVQLLIDEDVKAVFTYDLKGSILAGTGTFTFDNYSISYTPKHFDDASSNLQPIQEMYIEYVTQSEYVSQFFATKILGAGYTLQSYDGNTAVINTTYNGVDTTLYINFNTEQVVVRQNNIDRDTEETWGENNSIHIFAEDVRTINMLLLSIFEPENITVNEITNNSIQCTIDEEEITVDTVALLDPTKFSKVDFLYTRVDEPVLADNKFAEIVSEDEFQFLKQQWDTTNETENFWWIDNNSVLALTKDKLYVRHKTNELDDWNGNIFTAGKEYARTDYLNTSVLKYFCTSAYNNQTARFVTVTGGNVITINLYNPLNNMIKNTFTVGVVKREINKTGMLLCPDANNIYSYSDLIVDNVISQSKWTATCIDNYCIIGVHFDNNFNQWAIIINLTNNTLEKIIQGYGFVGVNGCLTGGEIPAKWFNVAKGFTGTVLSLDCLSDTVTEVTDIKTQLHTKLASQIVGTEAQQWYIDTEIKEIVSHITYKNGVFTAQRLPLNNNYSIRYDSGSFAIQVSDDNDIKTANLWNLLDNWVWHTLCTSFLNPVLWFIAPKITIANYLQQTLGQAAYVHYNSTSIRQQQDLTKENIINNYSKEEADAAYDKSKEEAAISSDELSFDRQSVKQTSQIMGAYDGIIALLTASIMSATDYAFEKLQVNQNQNQSAISDFGKKYTQFFLQNINSMAPSSMYLQSATPTQTSEVTAIKTLDMFYSTADKQQIAAGPGYVNHNFVAQCVSQSVTSVQSEFRQQKYTYFPSALSEYTLVYANQGVSDALHALEMGAGVSSGSIFTSAAGAGIIAAWVALKAANIWLDVGVHIMPSILSALGADTVQSKITATQSRHNYDIEGKHKYGSKSESFMWPCFGIPTAQSILDESVEVVTQNKSWKASLDTQVNILSNSGNIKNVTNTNNNNTFDSIPYYIAMIKGVQSKVKLPEKMAYVIGTESFLPATDFKNENISESEPVFATAPFQDYIIDENWQISQTASVGMTTWVSCKDTKIIDGEFSNCVINNNFCGIASPYTAIEVKRGINKRFLRPWAITPQVMALNNTGLNTCFEEKAYHGFDGFGYRVTNWIGSAGMNKEKQTWMYSFLVNDRFKRSNKLPPNEFMGNFKCDPVVAITGDYNDKVFTLVTQPGENIGIQAGTIGEDKDVRRYSLPIFSEFVNTLPAAVKTISAQVLSVVDGITSLTTENRDLQTAYKAPLSVDFTIGKNKYRFTQDYICSLTQESGVTLVEQLVPCLGLTFIGSTPYEAYLYSQATRQYYVFTGGSSLKMVDMIERFYDIISGRYDFVNQEVLLPCTATFLRLDKDVKDDEDITDNVIVPRLKDNSFLGEVYPPIDTIYNTRSWFRTLSLPCGITYQGPNRCIINRFVVQKYMTGQIRDNYGLWKRVPREEYHPFRVYKDKYSQVDKYIGDNVQVKGWTHNPFLLVTSPLGVAEETDCKFEWEITFCWPVEMEELYGKDNYATVNIQAETITPGGKVVADRPVHVFLTKELFTRTNNFGYYSFKYQSNCGAGNRERLHIWSDQYICVSGLQLEYSVITDNRTEILTQQVDVQQLKEI